MDISAIESFWITKAEEALQVVDHLMERGDYSYALFFGHLAIEKLLKALYMVARTENIKNDVNRFINELRKKYRVYAAYIYGSYSKGDANVWSDIDVAVVSPDFSDDLFDERLELMRIAAFIDDRIEPHPFKVEDFESSNPLVSEIQKYGILLS